MKRLAYLLPLVCLGFGIGACGDDGTGVVDTDNDSDNDDDDPSTMSATSPTTTLTTDTTSATETTTEPTSSESSGGDMCTPDDECRDATDCEVPGSTCLACFCIPPDGCTEWGPGEFGACVVEGSPEPDLTVCGDGAEPQCLVDDVVAPNSGVCYFSGCKDECDCPQPPAGFEENVACEDIVGVDAMNDCFIDCSDNGSCPDGMYCYMDAICFHGVETGVEPYGDCVNTTLSCLEGICFPGEDWGWCTNIECADASECPEAPEGTAVPACEDLLQDAMMNPISACFLDCSGDATCPTGMVCDTALAGGICIWELAEPGYGDCANSPEEDVCLDDETCQLDATQDPEQGVCAATDCTDPNTDCPVAPEGGDAPRICLDVDAAGGAECVLDCSGDQTCPSGMACGAADYCVWLDQGPCFTAIGDPSFESGTPNDAWDEESLAFGTPLCDAGCGLGGAPRTGDWYVWFGGTDEQAEVGSVTQDITIPTEAQTLSFWLSFSVVTTVNPELDNVEVLIDDTQIFVATGEDGEMYDGYTQVTLDITAFADGGVHTLVIQSSTEGDEITNIFVDDVTLLCN
jgi:hypothetical protein